MDNHKEPLIIQTQSVSNMFSNMLITGFEQEELDALKNMDTGTAKEIVLSMLDERNFGIGTCWKCGYGIYGFIIGNGCVNITIGNSCD